MGVWTGLCRHLPENTDSGFPSTTEQRPQKSTSEIKDLCLSNDQWPSLKKKKNYIIAQKIKLKKIKLKIRIHSMSLFWTEHVGYNK